MVDISTIVITKNEAHNLPRCLASVRSFSHEVVVVDSGSTDGTLAAASAAGARVIPQEWLGYGRQKQFALEQARSPWVFSIDADEEVSAELAAEIARLDFAADGYFVARRVWYLGRWIRHGVWNPDFVMRLFRRDRARFTPERVHERVDLTGRAETLRWPLYHYSYRDVAHHLAKINEMSTLSAEQMAERGKRASWAKLTLSPGWEFFRSYVWQRGFQDGAPGLVVAKLHAYYHFLKYAKLRELEKR
ncbi:MAG TPA: glycosyltransferase family 2 protein [Candidatus Eisenbacteria bacterium]|nr:glycosyltransferase family 2 protein [Candidatus Eisenbacteria bacterium]